MGKDSLEIGRLHYFEPSTIAFDNREGTYSDSITFPYDKYNIAVDLRVFVNDRYSCGMGNLSGEITEYVFSTTGGTLSFLGGTNGYLTTNYTDIQNINPSQNTQECLGIESINISYDSWLHPTVVIKFIDVRGATVMQPSEQNYYNEGNQGETYYLYKSLFTFPYPLFILKVKGFYGKGVTYRLAVNKVDIDFDSKNGNFIITVNFIGHVYGLFADIPMSFLAIAPYTEEGAKYWDDRVSSEAFYFHRIVDGNEVPDVPMLKLPELAKKVAEVEYAQNIVNQQSETHRMMQDLDTESELLSNIIGYYNDLFKNHTEQSYYYGDSMLYAYFENDSSNPTLSYLFVYDKDVENEVVEKFKSLSEALSLHDSGSSESLKSSFGAIDSWPDTRHYYNFYETGNKDNNKWVAESSTYNFLNSYQDEYKGLILNTFNVGGEKTSKDLADFINFCILRNNSLMTNFKLFVHDRGCLKTYKQAIDEIGKRKENIEKKKESKLSELKKENESNIEKALGFRPSIKNIFDLVFAHLETFIHVYFEHLKIIKDELKEKNYKRDKETYKIEEGFTDTEKAGSGRNMRGSFLPPFAAFYENWNAEDGKKYKREIWPGKLTSGNPEENLEEIRFVYELLNGSKLYFEQMQDAQRIIEGYRASGTTIDGSLNSPSTDTTDFIPITVFDIANNGRYSNPYKSISDKIDSNANIDEIIGDVYALFSLRMFYYLASKRKSETDISATGFGRVEAVNFYKALGTKRSRTFKDFIGKFADDSDLKSEKNSFIGKITIDSNDEIASSWQINSSNQTRKRLFVKDGKNYLEYCYCKPDNTNNNFVYLPLYISGLNQFKNDFSSDGLKTNERYISTTNHEYFYGGDNNLTLGKTLNGGTFLLFEDRDYVNNLYAKIQNELIREKEDVEDENVKSLLDLSNYEVKRGSKTYGYISDDINGDCNCVLEGGSYRFISEENSDKKLQNSEIESLIKTGSDDDKHNVFIEDCGDIFRYDLYRLQTNVYAKAYLFLQTLPLSRDENIGLTDRINTVAQKVSLLREGAYYWWVDNRDTNFIISGNVNTYTYELDENKMPIQKKAHDASYKLPKSNETFFFCGSSRNFLPINSSAIGDKCYYAIPNRFINTSDNVSKSRQIYLKKYFENWVKDEKFGFEKHLNLLENLELRTIRPYNGINKYSYISPLNIDYARMRYGESVLVEDAKQLQTFLRDLLFGVCTIFDYYGGFYGKDMIVSASDFKNGFLSFMKQLNKIYKPIVDATSNEYGKAFAEKGITKQLEDPFKSDDFRLSTYLTLKSLYDKWICASLKGEDSWKINTRSNFNSKTSDMYERTTSEVNKDSGLYELDNFIYMDSLYRDISHKLRVNLSKVTDWLTRVLPSTNVSANEIQMNHNSKSLYEFLTEVAQDCGGYIFAIPQRFMFNNAEDIKNIFTPIPSCDKWDDNAYTYMFLYNYQPSEHLGNASTNDMDMNGWSPSGDGYDLTDEYIVGELYSDENGSFGVPAFGVTFGKGNQSYFKDIKLSSGQFGVTEAGLNATFQIAAKGSESIRQTTLYGQDIYKVYANNAYECTVEMMGDMQIFPPMLFQLNNIPMWRGAYMIKKVTHVITPGDATTTIVGVRQNKYLVPFAEGDVVSFVEDFDNSSSYVNYNENPSTNGYGNFRPKNNGETCREYMDSLGGKYTSTYIGKYNGEYDVDRICSYIRSHALQKSQGCCAAFVRVALEYGGALKDIYYGDAKTYIDYLPTVGYTNVASFSSSETNVPSYISTKGDVAVYHHPNEETGLQQYQYGHICIFDGKNWVSDFIQKNVYVYGKYSGSTTIYIFRHT